MFRPADPAIVRSTGVTVTVQSTLPERKWLTSAGVFAESDLQMAHPSCLPTMEGRHLEAEIMQERYKQDKSTRIPYEKTDLLEKALKDAPRDIRGHWRNGADISDRKEFDERMVDRISLILATTPEVGVDRVIAAAAPDAPPLAEWVTLGNLRHGSPSECGLCGADDLLVETNGKAVRLSGKPCPYSDGFPVTEWEMNIPSGKLVVANDLRVLFPLPDGDDDIESINTTLGCHQTTLAYAAVGMAHGSVGNSCPSVYKLPKGQGYSIGTKSGVSKGAKAVAGICTDLWWYSICDKDEFDRRCQKFSDQIVKKKRKGSKTPAEDPVKVALEHWNCDVVDVEPGVYRFRHDYNVDRNEYNVVFTRFERVRAPDPVKDFLSLYESAEVNAHAYVQAQVANWPTLYTDARSKKEAKPWAQMSEKEQFSSWQRVADHVMCVIGGGTDWHEKGFPQAKVDPNIKDIPCPKFRGQFHWYPFSATYGGLFEPKVLSPSFARMAFEVLESCISFGMNVRFGTKHREVSDTRHRMLLAVKRYRELVKANPNIADPDYATWIMDGGRAEMWVEKFDLGPKIMQSHLDHQVHQMWLPEGTYAVEFDARKIPGNATGFAWHPQNHSCGGCWARKEDAQRWALQHHEPNVSLNKEEDDFWTSNAGMSIPLLSVARVVNVGAVSHMGDRLVEVVFDYGSPWMLGKKAHKAFKELGDKAGLRPLTEAEYQEALPKMIAFFEEAEAGIKRKT